MQRTFERLEVWQKARRLVKLTYELVSKFPIHERYGLSDQMRRAAISIPSNLAEGSGRTSYKEKAHFCEISYGSMMELSSQLILAVDFDFLSKKDIEEAQSLIDDLERQLCAFRKHLLTKANTPA